MSNKYEMNEGDISLFYRTEGENSKKPLYTGEIMLPGGEIQRVALWPWTGRNGSRGLSGKYEPKREQQQQPEPAGAAAGDDVPW